MEFTNFLNPILDKGSVSISHWSKAIETLLMLLSPTAPHMAEELWERTGNTYSVHNQSWPTWDEELAKEEEVTLVIQVNGKVRDKILVPASITEDEARELAMDRERIKAYTAGKTISKVIYIPQKLVSIVVG
jgi:leucyl-tRNA synthetase